MIYNISVQGSYYFEGLYGERNHFIVGGDYYPLTNEFGESNDIVRFKISGLSQKIFALCLGDGI